MNRTPFSRILLLSTSILAVVPVKCNSILAKRAPVVDDGYEYVVISGSNIPQRVKKGSRPVTASPVEVYGAESVRDFTQRNQTMGKLPAGGK